MRSIFLLLAVCSLATVSTFSEELHINESSDLPCDAPELYIDLMKRILVNTIYEDIGTDGVYNPSNRDNGYDWPTKAHTMVGRQRLNNLHFCLKKVLDNGVPGDCIETGVWRGGCCILMRAILKAYNDSKRKVWVADSFAGFPKPNRIKYPADAGWRDTQDPVLTVSMEQVMNNFRKYDLFDQQVVFVKGFFSETLPKISLQRIALLRLDGDWYESTMDALVNLYPKLSKNGFIIIDDYCMDSCKKAVTDYRNQHNITDPILPIDNVGVYWEKTED